MVNLHFCVFVCDFRLFWLTESMTDRVCETPQIVDVNWAQLTEHSSAFLSGIIFQTLIWLALLFFSLSEFHLYTQRTGICLADVLRFRAFDLDLAYPQSSTFCNEDIESETPPLLFFLIPSASLNVEQGGGDGGMVWVDICDRKCSTVVQPFFGCVTLWWVMVVVYNEWVLSC